MLRIMMRKIAPWIIVLIAIGAVNAALLKVFEFIVIDGTIWLWNDVLNTDVMRWAVVPVAVIGSILLTMLFRATKQRRIVKPKLDPIEEEPGPHPKVTRKNIGASLVQGMGSLLAGGSLGPEASLMAFSENVGLWSAAKAKFGTQQAGLLVLASIGALLVAFLGSIIPVLLPLLIHWQKRKLSWHNPRQLIYIVFSVLLAGGASYSVLTLISWLQDEPTSGFGTIPIDAGYLWLDVPLAFVLGAGMALTGLLLKALISGFNQLSFRIDKSLHWAASAAIFGLGIGVLYLAGGETVQFSGSVGSHLLAENAAEYGLWTLLGLLAVKLLVTAWSLASGYRGGLVFPSIYIGVAAGLIGETIVGHTAAGIVIGSIAGVFGAMTGPAVALIFIASILPVSLIPIAVVGILGSILGNKLIASAAGKRPARHS